MKKTVVFFIVFSIIMSLGANFQARAEADVGGWHLKDIVFIDKTRTALSGVMASKGTLNDEYSYSGEKNNMTISHYRYHYNTETKTNTSLVAKKVTNQKWTEPQSFVKEGERIIIDAENELLEYEVWKTPHSLNFGGQRYGELMDSDGKSSLVGGKGTFRSRELQKGKLGDTITCQVHLGDGFKYEYIYEWKDQGPAIVAPSENNAEAFGYGTRIMWTPATGLGYRLFRSTTSSELGISVTDFYITSRSYADVNVEANTTYYYTVKPVLAEAKPFEGIDEKLGDTIASFVVKTGAEVYKPGSFKHFIMLKLEDPNMSVDGISQEVDPGRGTVPLVITGRTMVPIRAIVEAIGGSVEWDGNTQKITLKARENIVEMWIGKTEIKVNGESKKMDIAPSIRNARTFVPVRFAAENLNCKVDWINSTREAVIVYEE